MHLAPSLRLSDLLVALQPVKILNERELQNPWAQANDEVVWFSKSAWSLAAIALAKASHQAQSADSRTNPVNVWLPAFFCNESLAPMRKTGARLHFYNTNEQLDPDPESLADLARNSTPDIIIGVHFFGMPANFENLVRHSLSSGAWLVEDATHVLRKRKSQGDQGDFVLFSPHKHLALPHGALLVIRSGGPNNLTELQGSFTRIVSDLRDQYGQVNESKHHVLIWVIKRLINRFGIRRKVPNSPLHNEGVVSSGSTPANPEMSALARRLLARYVSQMDQISEVRKTNYDIWNTYLSVLSSVKKLNDIATDREYTPYTAAFIGCSETIASEHLNFLKQVGAQPTKWPDLPPEVMADSARYGTALEFFNRVTHLPTHQDVSHRSIIRIGLKLVRKVSRSWQTSPVSEADWEVLWSMAKAPNLIQSWQYGTALEQTKNVTVTRWVIRDELAHPIGLAQVVASKRPPFLEIHLVNQGPVWLGASDVTAAQYAMLASALRKKIGWAKGPNKLRILVFSPPIKFSRELANLLNRLGFGRSNRASWSSSRIDLHQDTAQIMAGMNGKWRNGLRKGQRSMLNVKESADTNHDWTVVRQLYCDLILPRAGSTMSPEVFDAMISQPLRVSWKVQLFLASKTESTDEVNLLGAILVVKSGRVSTYLMGVSTEEGRRINATSVLLWEALNKQKELGAGWFDLGGISSQTPRGIAHFKEGLGGESYSTGGYYWTL